MAKRVALKCVANSCLLLSSEAGRRAEMLLWCRGSTAGCCVITVLLGSLLGWGFVMVKQSQREREENKNISHKMMMMMMVFRLEDKGI